MTPERRQELQRRMRTASLIRDNRLATNREFHRIENEWRLLKDYSDAISLNRLFIRGERTFNINHMARLEPDSEPLIPALLSLHDYGILTYNSQPFKKAPKFINQGGGFWIQNCQRPYLQFLIPKNHRLSRMAVSKFCTLLLENKKIATLINQQTRHLREFKRDKHLVQYRSTMGHYEPVTGRRSALSVKELYAEEYEHCTALGQEFRHDADDWEVEAINDARCLDVQVVGRRWSVKLDLLALVKDIAFEAGLKPEYAEWSDIENIPGAIERTFKKQENRDDDGDGQEN